MADYMAGEITIAGVVTPLRRIRLAHAIAESDAQLNYGIATLDFQESLSAIDFAIDKGKPLALFADEVSGGAFPSIEAACQSLKLPYRRWSDAKYESSSCVEIFNGDTIDTFPSDSDGTVLLPLATVQEAVRDGTIAEYIASVTQLTDALPALIWKGPDGERDDRCLDCHRLVVPSENGAWRHVAASIKHRVVREGDRLNDGKGEQDHR